MKQTKCLAMLLAGGQGSRLYALTSKLAKPAVSFGGKYRIIDFTLSNCVNSGISTVGVLTQYQPLVLHDYIGNGEPWDLDRNYGGVHLLPPYQAKDGGEWYKGTANAIYQNLGFINGYSPDNVLILSGDHIYKMDYNKMLDYHIEKNADCTIAVIGVPIEEASRFGIMSFDKAGRITEFAEKPKVPKSNNASMGIYIFKTKLLETALSEDEKNPASSKDFGKDVIPRLLKEGKRMFAYSFDGYWKDVGTLTSLWEANMDLIGGRPRFDISGADKVYSRDGTLPPSYIGAAAAIENSLVTTGCEILGTVENSVIASGVYVGKRASVRNSVIHEGARIEDGANVNFGIVDEQAVVGKNCAVGGGDSGKDKIALVARGVKVPAGTVIKGGEIFE